MLLKKVTKEQFEHARHPEDKNKISNDFASRLNMNKKWKTCLGCWENDELLGVTAVNINRRVKNRATVQGLYVFARYRGRGIEEVLLKHILKKAKQNDIEYLRMSIHEKHLSVYEKCGFKILGRQRSGYFLSVCRLSDFSFDMSDPVIYKQVHLNGSGSCVQIYGSDKFVDNDSWIKSRSDL